MRAFEISGTYGSGYTPCTVFCIDTGGGTWYCVEDSKNVNFTYEELQDGVDVETVSDDDHFYSDKPVASLAEFEQMIEDHENGEE